MLKPGIRNKTKEAIVIALVLSAGVMSSANAQRPVASLNPAAPAVRSAMRMAVYVPVRQGDSVKLVEQVLSVPGNIQPHTAAIGYLARPGGVLPKGTRVRNLALEQGVLTIDFSPELRRFRGGSSDEALLLAALSATVAGFEGVKAFQITVQGQPLSILGGHADLSEPYPASKSLPEDFR